MNFHQIGQTPRTLHLNLCPHGVNRELGRWCLECDGPRLNEQQRIQRDFIAEHGEEGLQCVACGHKEFRRSVQEIWERMQYVDLSTTREDEYNAYGSQSAADYYDDHDSDHWECTSCETTVTAGCDFDQLLNEIEKESF